MPEALWLRYHLHDHDYSIRKAYVDFDLESHRPIECCIRSSNDSGVEFHFKPFTLKARNSSGSKSRLRVPECAGLSLGAALQGGEEQCQEIKVGLIGFETGVAGVQISVRGLAWAVTCS
jgi:hypothetical protein